MGSVATKSSRGVRSLVKRYRSAPPVELAEAAVRRMGFERDRRRRRHRYGSPEGIEHPDILRQLHESGVASVPSAFDPAAVRAIAAELDAVVRRGEPLNKVSNDVARSPGDLSPATVFLGVDELAAGESSFRKLTNYVSVEEPLFHCPSTTTLVFASLLDEIATDYLGCRPAIGGVNLRRSYVNDLADFDTLYFHSDPNSPKFLKFFIYLNEVDEHGGPFCYVTGSHRKKFRGWRAQYRWTPEQIEDRFGAARLRYMTGRVGDLVIADTTGFHRGTKVRSADRSMLTVDYVLHPEFDGSTPAPKIARATVSSLPADRRHLVDLLDVVDS